MDIFTVIVTKPAARDLNRIPGYVVLKLQAWVDDIENRGLREVRKISGYHDEPLKGNSALFVSQKHIERFTP